MFATTVHLTASNSLELSRAITPSERGAQRTLGLLIKVLQRMKEAKVTRNSNYLTPVTQKNILRKDSKYTVEELPITETEKHNIKSQKQAIFWIITLSCYVRNRQRMLNLHNLAIAFKRYKRKHLVLYQKGFDCKRHFNIRNVFYISLM